MTCIPVLPLIRESQFGLCTLCSHIGLANQAHKSVSALSSLVNLRTTADMKDREPVAESCTRPIVHFFASSNCRCSDRSISRKWWYSLYPAKIKIMPAQNKQAAASPMREEL